MDKPMDNHTRNQRPPPPHFRHQYNTTEEIPPQHRRTLILSSIPPSLTYKEIRRHFTDVGMICDFCTIDRKKGEAYVKFRERGDVLRLWEGGEGLLDGDAGGRAEVSLVKAGVKIKAIHFTNQIAWIPEGDSRDERQQLLDRRGGKFDRVDQCGQFDNKRGQFDRKRSWDGRDGGGRRSEGSGLNVEHGRSNYNAGRYEDRDRGRDDANEGYKVQRCEHHKSTPARNYDYNSHDAGYGHNQPSSSSHQSREVLCSATPSNKAATSDPSYGHSSATSKFDEYSPNEPVQIHSSSTPLAQTSWHRNPPSHRQNTNNNAQQLQQITTLQQKCDLLQKQETALQKQLLLQKKMLSLLKDKATKEDQSTKLKEILTTQTKIMELKKERMEGLKTLEGLKENHQRRDVGGVGNRVGIGKKKLDLRSRVLMIQGFPSGATEVRHLFL